MHRDDRGCFTEMLRLASHDSPVPVQWNVVTSAAEVLRGVHVHKVHWDYFFLVSGEMLFGMHDMRLESPTYRCSAMLRLTGETLSGLVIPPGVAHGFYYVCPSIHVYAVSDYWDPADELGCRWNCPELGLDWKCVSPKLSKRDHDTMSYDRLVAALAGRQP